MSDVTISKELLQALIDFADNCTSAKDWPTQNRQISEARAILAAPAPDTVTYTGTWQSNYGLGGIDFEGIDFKTATERIQSLNETWSGINHWAVGTDGSIIGRVGAPE